MQITPLETTTDLQVGGGGGYVADQVRAGLGHARIALDIARLDWDRTPTVGPQPREAAYLAAREAAAHLTDALGVEAPQDAIDETRRALEEIGHALFALERMKGRPPFVPVEKPIGHFEQAVRMLEQVETKLRTAIVGFG